MTLQHRPYVGYEITCDARYCPATTATFAPRHTGTTPELARAAARAMLWLTIRVADRTRWICPLQQTYDPRLARWVPIPLVTE